MTFLGSYFILPGTKITQFSYNLPTMGYIDKSHINKNLKERLLLTELFQRLRMLW